MTKLQILQFACTYINDLSEILCDPMADCGDDDIVTSHGMTAIDNFMTYVTHEQHLKDAAMLMTSHGLHGNGNNNNGNHGNDVNINMMQRLDYLTLHTQMGAMQHGGHMQGGQICLNPNPPPPHHLIGDNGIGMMSNYC